MLRIRVFQDGEPAKSVDIASAYLVGNDRVPLRAEVKFSNGEIVFDTRSRGAAALAILWPVAGVGRVMLETPRLQERKTPYNLNVELARGQLMRIAQKREDWGLYDFAEGAALYKKVDAARQILVAALTAEDESSASRHADECLSAGVRVGEELTALHAQVFLGRRGETGQFSKRTFGCRVDPSQSSEAFLKCFGEGFDFAVLPFSWSSIEPQDGSPKPSNMDGLLKTLWQRRVALWAASLVSLDPVQLPGWVQKSGRDFEKFREYVTRHVRHVLKTYGPYVQAWEVISAAHAYNSMGFTFEQIMDLTRITALLVKQMSPKSQSIIGIVQPWGEYYARDARTIPPSLYAEMAVQSGINFDAFGLEIRFGTDEPGGCVRDLLQISSLLDRFGTLGKPVHITAAGVPSGRSSSNDGQWHGEWSPELQGEWLREFCRIALSKPFVESIACMRLADGADPNGVVDLNGAAKPAYQEILKIRRQIGGNS
ncbi:MAG: hypothetical protein KF841_05285 [Phycisphaerae bacterium]|nr:hypothetical protein [Phycisphaerae bacterium]